MRGYATNAADDAALFAPIVGESMMVAGVRVTLGARGIYRGQCETYAVAAKPTTIDGVERWAVQISTLDGSASGVAVADTLEDAERLALGETAASLVCSALAALGTAVQS